MDAREGVHVAYRQYICHRMRRSFVSENTFHNLSIDHRMGPEHGKYNLTIFVALQPVKLHMVLVLSCHQD